ncbi:acylneuraminate cytidylyltransferase family protein [Flavobacterium suncheonense]|uniref:acylneuraminate cytidylyltransferase family protein n=1 Tax=Flavobacterium suncheonense TaxID=350894 RepID=UPI003FA3643C
MKVLGIIPARGGSKGVPGKNIKDLGGKPLLQYTFESALDSKLLSRTILSSEDAAIIEKAKIIGLEVPFVRPDELASDSASSIQVVRHAVDFLESEGFFYDAVCLLQPTYPFREKGFIDKAIQKFEATGADTLVSVLPVPHEYNPHWTFEKDADGYLKIATGEEEIITRRQNLPTAYHRDGAIYITKVTYIKQGTFYGKKMVAIESEHSHYVNIDTLKDWEKAEAYLKYSNKI